MDTRDEQGSRSAGRCRCRRPRADRAAHPLPIGGRRLPRRGPVRRRRSKYGSARSGPSVASGPMAIAGRRRGRTRRPARRMPPPPRRRCRCRMRAARGGRCQRSPGRIEMPRPVHPHMRAQHEPARERHQQVLAGDRHRSMVRPAIGVSSSTRASGARPVAKAVTTRAGERAVKRCRRAGDGVAFRHPRRSCAGHAARVDPPGGAARAAAGRRWSRRSRPRRNSARTGWPRPARRSAPPPAIRGARRWADAPGAPARAPAPGPARSIRILVGHRDQQLIDRRARSSRGVSVHQHHARAGHAARLQRAAGPHAGHSTSAPYGIGGIGGRQRHGHRRCCGSRSARSRSIAPGSANCAPPSPATK